MIIYTGETVVEHTEYHILIVISSQVKERYVHEKSGISILKDTGETFL